jgi:hypothetical protein
MKSILILSFILGLGAACSKQPPTSTGPAPAADPKAISTVPAKAADNAAPVPGPMTTASGSSPTSPTPGISVFNQFDPPMPLPVSR